MADRLKTFRIDRISKIIAGETPIAMDAGAKIIVHLLPIVAFAAGNFSVDLTSLWRTPNALVNVLGSGGSPRYNADGIFFAHDAPAMRYAQIFRNGCIEVAVALSATAIERKSLPVQFAEAEILERIHEGKGFIEQLGVTPPLVVAVSIVGANGWNLALRHGRASRSQFDRDPLLLPDLSLPTFDGQTPTELKPVIDYLWNAAGEPFSPSYNQNGEYRPQ